MFISYSAPTLTAVTKINEAKIKKVPPKIHALLFCYVRIRFLWQQWLFYEFSIFSFFSKRSNVFLIVSDERIVYLDYYDIYEVLTAGNSILEHNYLPRKLLTLFFFQYFLYSLLFSFFLSPILFMKLSVSMLRFFTHS